MFNTFYFSTTDFRKTLKFHENNYEAYKYNIIQFKSNTPVFLLLCFKTLSKNFYHLSYK